MKKEGFVYDEDREKDLCAQRHEVALGIDADYVIIFDNDIWVQTSYNTFGNVHKLGGTPFRKNYAGIGYVYDPVRDAFIPPKPHPSWTLNESTGLWDPPVPYPDDGKVYIWKESDMKWELKEE